MQYQCKRAERLHSRYQALSAVQCLAQSGSDLPSIHPAGVPNDIG